MRFRGFVIGPVMSWDEQQVGPVMKNKFHLEATPIEENWRSTSWPPRYSIRVAANASVILLKRSKATILDRGLSKFASRERRKRSKATILDRGHSKFASGVLLKRSKATILDRGRSNCASEVLSLVLLSRDEKQIGPVMKNKFHLEATLSEEQMCGAV